MWRVSLPSARRVPKAVEDVAVDLFGSKASVVMTNVAGPHEPMHLAGVPIERILPWAPHPGKQLGMAVSILVPDTQPPTINCPADMTVSGWTIGAPTVPAVWMFNYFTNRIDGFDVEMDNSSSELIDYFIKRSSKGKR